MEPGKPKPFGKKTKWEKRRIARRFARVAGGKKLLVESLTIALRPEREAALKRGKIALYDGGRKVELDLASQRRGDLQGVFREHGGRIIVLRSGLFEETKVINFYIVKGNTEMRIKNAFALRRASGQLLIPEEFGGQGLGLKAGSKIERDLRAKCGGEGIIYNDCDTMQALFGKLGYRRNASAKEIAHVITKSGKFVSKDNLDRFHRIEAIDPKTGKARIFTFPIEKIYGN